MGDPLTYVASPSQAANFLQKDSFIIYRVDDETALAIDRASLAATNFFRSTAINDKKEDYQRIVEGHLYGYNEPSPAKVLFRAFCGSSHQPWPNDTFRIAASEVAQKLHKLLSECCREIDRLPILVGNEKPVKRAKSLLIEDSVDLPETNAQCPLDFFLYHGRLEESVVNCSEHVDRGLLIAVCLTDVPGLEVLPREKKSFVCPEERILPSDGSYHVCIMTGDQLKKIRSDMPACVHRVRNDLMNERLSITYELRATDTKKKDG
jgi:hypothetical protein